MRKPVIPQAISHELKAMTFVGLLYWGKKVYNGTIIYDLCNGDVGIEYPDGSKRYIKGGYFDDRAFKAIDSKILDISLEVLMSVPADNCQTDDLCSWPYCLHVNCVEDNAKHWQRVRHYAKEIVNSI